MEKITSKNNTIIKDTKKLFTSSRARRESSRFVIEGARLCFDVLNSFYAVDTVFYTEDIYSRYGDRIDELVAVADRAYIVSDDVAQRLSETPTPQGVFVVCKMKEQTDVNISGKYIALDNVQDPSNVGAIIRTAEALGIDGIITYNCCDIYNPKALRATMGSVFRMNIVDTDDLKLTLTSLLDNGARVYSTVPDCNANKITDIDFSGDVVCVIGNEANGVEQEIMDISSSLITIPMLGRAESLNASVAASITMWEMMR